jgi:hypothetical protein
MSAESELQRENGLREYLTELRKRIECLEEAAKECDTAYGMTLEEIRKLEEGAKEMDSDYSFMLNEIRARVYRLEHPDALAPAPVSLQTPSVGPTVKLGEAAPASRTYNDGLRAAFDICLGMQARGMSAADCAAAIYNGIGSPPPAPDLRPGLERAVAKIERQLLHYDASCETDWGGANTLRIAAENIRAEMAAESAPSEPDGPTPGEDRAHEHGIETGRKEAQAVTEAALREAFRRGINTFASRLIERFENRGEKVPAILYTTEKPEPVADDLAACMALCAPAMTEEERKDLARWKWLAKQTYIERWSVEEDKVAQDGADCAFDTLEEMIDNLMAQENAND